MSQTMGVTSYDVSSVSSDHMRSGMVQDLTDQKKLKKHQKKKKILLLYRQTLEMKRRNKENRVKLQIYVHFGTISGGSRLSAQSCAKLRGVKKILDLTVNGFSKDIYYE